MYLFKLLALCLLCHECVGKEEDILEFFDSDFDSRIAEHETALVMFYAPWCEHCKRLKIEYAKAAEDLIRNDPPVALVKVDCTEDGKDICEKNDIRKYPTLKIYRNGKFYQDYNGPKEATGMIKYMKNHASSRSTKLYSPESLEKFLASENENVVVGFFEAQSPFEAVFFETAEDLRNKIKFAHTASKELMKKYDIKDGLALFRPSYLQNKFEDSVIKYQGRADAKDISEFIIENFHGLVGYRTSDNREEFQHPLVLAYYDVDYVVNIKSTNYWRNRILKVAKGFEGRINFAISDRDEFQDELSEYGLQSSKGGKPEVIARDDRNQKFVMKGDFSVESLREFVNNVLDRKLEPYLKSQPIPESQDKPVKVAVARNFNEMVMNSKRDILIKFYAPWCGHCVKLAPVYDELGETLKGEDIDIIKMDASANDIPPPYDVSGFPTLYWVSKNAKNSPQRYQGGRELADFMKFIAKHATNELEGYDRKGNPKSKKTEL